MAFLGIDLGTGSVKTMVIDRDGRAIATGTSAYRASTPRPGWVETPPAVWWSAVVAAVRPVVRDRTISAIGVCGQMHGVVLCAADAHPLRPAILWADARATSTLERYRTLPDRLTDPLANPITVGMMGPSLLWLGEHERTAYLGAAHALSPKDWLRLVLTGRAATEPSDASATLLYDVPGGVWHRPLVDALDLRADLLPDVVQSAEIAGELTAGAAQALGLAPGIPVAAGGADAAASLVGTGLTDIGDVQIVIGSGMQVLAPIAHATTGTGRVTHCFRGCGDEGWYRLAAMQNAGLALEWVRGVLGLTWERMYGEAFACPPGADGVAFVPDLSGERTPLLDPDAAGAWVGMRSHHTAAHLARAAFEGVAFALRAGVDALRETGVRIDRPVLAGGGSVDVRWRQMLSDVLGTPLAACQVPAASARGAALLAAVAEGAWRDVAATSALAPPVRTVAEPHDVPGLVRARSVFAAARARRTP